MKVLICGAGIAGLTLGLRLGTAGCHVTIVEAASALGGRDHLVELFGAGYDAADRLSLLPRLRESACVIPEALWIDRTGRPVASLHYARIERILDGRLVTLMRADLEQILFQALPRSVDVRFGHALEGIQLHRGGVEVLLSSGDREYADVLIGADGIESRVRGLVVGDSQCAFRFLGLHLAS
ncbi:MAG: NAD(P)-binding protein, partial [Candidatus Dormibacteraceae bacterium]